MHQRDNHGTAESGREEHDTPPQCAFRERVSAVDLRHGDGVEVGGEHSDGGWEKAGCLRGRAGEAVRGDGVLDAGLCECHSLGDCVVRVRCRGM